jgi:DNA mismatch repair ATPase MutS
MNRFKRISEVTAALDCITPFSVSFSKFTQVGVVMKNYYEFFASEDLDELIHYSFGLNAYLEHVGECGLLIKEGLLNQCTFDKSNEDETEDVVSVAESESESETKSETESETKSEHNEDRPDDVTKDDRESITHFTNQYYAPLMRKSPVKNDISLKKQVIITGPNAAGKTTLIKSTLFNIILSQQIGYGFYDTAHIIPYHYLHCYLNIPDTSGRDSLFQAESRRCKEIITCLTSNSDKRHFCIFDELYSGTNPYEAVAAAYGYIHYLSKMPNVDLMLTTHYIELCHLLSEHDRIDNLHMEASINDNFDLTYLYKVAKGVSTIKGGMKVLHDLEYPREVIDAATDILTKPRK